MGGGNYPLNKEVKTGEKRDGKDVYKTIIKVSSLPNATIQSFNHNISNVDKIWFDFSESFVKFSNGDIASLPYIGGSLNNTIEFTGLKSTSYQINTHESDRRNVSAEICLKYTKK